MPHQTVDSRIPSASLRPQEGSDESSEILRIAIIAESFLPAINGVTNSVLRVAENMRSRGHHVEIIAAGPTVESYLDIRVHAIPSVAVPLYSELRVGFSRKATLEALKSIQPDVVHIASPTVLGAIGLSCAVELKLSSVAIYQTDLAGFSDRYHLGLARRGIWRHLSSTHRKASLTLAPSTDSVWALRQHGVDNVVRWMRGVDVNRFNPVYRSEELRARLAPNGEMIIGYVGRLAREKRVELLRPITEIPGVKVVVVGDGPQKKSLQRQLPNALFVGFQGGDELSRYYASLDVFVHTGTNETFCQSVQEALSSGVPVIAPANGGPLDLVQHGVNGYLWTESTPGSLKGAVEELVKYPVKLERMASHSRTSVEHRTWTSVMDELEGHYKSVIGGLSFAYRELSA
jgi:phosphatidylinositol alpha 1,6-mannosyltransferase